MSNKKNKLGGESHTQRVTINMVYIDRQKNFCNQQHWNKAIAVKNRHFHKKSENWKARKLDETERVTTNRKGIWRKQNKLPQKYQIPSCQKANLIPKDVSKNKVA